MCNSPVRLVAAALDVVAQSRDASLGFHLLASQNSVVQIDTIGLLVLVAIGIFVAFAALVFGLAGLALSWAFDLSTGACIIAVAGTTYLVATLRAGK